MFAIYINRNKNKANRKPYFDISTYKQSNREPKLGRLMNLIVLIVGTLVGIFETLMILILILLM